MLKRFLLIAGCGVLLLSVPKALLSQGNSQGHGKGHNKQAQDNDDDRGNKSRGGVRIVFSVHDRDIIRDYYHDQYSNLPPGLAKRGGNLPPGLQKHLERDGTLPPGLQKRVQPFPVELERRLPRLPDTYTRVTLGVDILILDRRTQRIMDIVHDVLRP
ncbi:MAG TPA: hypothetical protein VFR84_14125 [Candidatus Angelobacter sp.]|nr:hypothetical protein [Candidatus Angelobacter sp.]